MTNQLHLRFYMMFVKLSSLQHRRQNTYYQSIFCCVRVHVPWLWCKLCGKNRKKVIYERRVEHAWSDQNSIVKNHLDRCVEVKYLLKITSSGPALFLNENNIGSADNRNSRINLAIDNTNIIDHYKILPFFCLKRQWK